MSYEALLPETCTVYRRTVDTSKKTSTESWSLLETVKCRILKQSMLKANVEKAQYATLVKTRFCVPRNSSVTIRDRIEHGGRRYDVVEVVTAYGRNAPHHKIAVCEVFAGAA